MEIYELIVKIIGIAFFAFIIFLFIAVFIRNCQAIFGSVKTVDAKIVKKYKVDEFSKYSGTGQKHRYVVVFETNGKLLRLNVSEVSYSGYRVNEKGRLTYKGNRVYDFS